MDEDEARGGIGKAGSAEQPRHWDQHRLERDEAGKQHHAEHDLVARKTPFGQNITVQRTQERRDGDGRHNHFQRIPEIAFDADAGDADTGLAPGFYPGGN